jgi:hypothetical protein
MFITGSPAHHPRVIPTGRIHRHPA